MRRNVMEKWTKNFDCYGQQRIVKGRIILPCNGLPTTTPNESGERFFFLFLSPNIIEKINLHERYN